MQPNPRAQFTQRGGEIANVGAHYAASPQVAGVTQIGAVGAGVLGDNQKLFHACRHQALGLPQHVRSPPAFQPAAHGGNDAEAALVVAALGDLEIGVVPRRELDPLGRHQIQERIVPRRQVGVDRVHHLLVLLRPGDREHAGVGASNHLGLYAEAAGDDDLAVLGHGLADGLQGLLDGVVDETAGVHHHQIGVVVAADHVIALHPELGEDTLGIHQRLGAAEADKTDAWCCTHGRRNVFVVVSMFSPIPLVPTFCCQSRLR